MRRFGTKSLVAALALALLAPAGCEETEEAAVVDAGPTAPTETELLAGTWVRSHKAGRAEYEFRADGTYTQRSYQSRDATEPDTVTDGSFEALGSVLTLSTELSTEFGPYVRDGGTFSREQVYLRKSPGDAAAGTWEAIRERKRRSAPGEELTVDEKRTDRLVLNDDGTMTFDHEVVGPNGGVVEQESRTGTWTQEGDVITTQDDQQVLSLKLSGEVLYDTSGSWLFARD
jgi:hypothetical protein